ncbi:MAG: hypothetical protein Q8934_14215 [Bacillota bacterium]|nr:hypothetical protein [Bacillota bacterium]
MKVNELIKKLSNFHADLDVKIAGIFNADIAPKADDWSEDENFREAESGDFDIYSEETKGNEEVVIQFFI